MEISAEELIKKWSLNWLSMDVMIGGKSSIDLSELRLADYEEAKTFVRSYGYDPDTPKDRRFIDAVMIEAVNFIMRYLVTESCAAPPKEILHCDDVCKL